jgi:Fe-S-cluster containining protein
MSDVPCAACTACCRQQIVVLGEADAANFAHYDFRQVGDLRVLNHQADGACVHLGDRGCTIYEKRPQTCRTYDCRKQLKILAGNERRRFRTSAMGEAAQTRIGTLDAADLADLADYRRRAAYFAPADEMDAPVAAEKI